MVSRRKSTRTRKEESETIVGGRRRRRLSSPRGTEGAEAAELTSNGKPRSRKVTKKSVKTEKTAKEPKVIYNLYEVKLPDKTIIQRRIRSDRELTGVIMVKLVEDGKWYVLLWSTKDADLEKRADKIAEWYMEEEGEKFRTLLYDEVGVGVDNITLVEEDFRGKVEFPEDRKVLNEVRYAAIDEYHKMVQDSEGDENDGGDEVEETPKKKKTTKKTKAIEDAPPKKTPKKRAVSKKPVA